MRTNSQSERDARERRVAGLSSGQREILDKLLGMRQHSRPKLAPRERMGSEEVSYAQKRMWILDRLMPPGQLYNETTFMRFRREVNPAVIERSLNEIVRRHDVLRTTFQQTNDRLVQVIAPTLTIAVPIIDLRNVPTDALPQEMERLARVEGRRLFDLGSGPLIRAVLLRASAEWALVVTLHHIVVDGWSMCVLIRELATLEKAFAAGKPSPLAELPLQYADFARWQRQCLRGQPLDQELQYWTKQLANLSVLQLPCDRPRPPLPSLDGERHPIKLRRELIEQLQALGSREGATLFMTLLSTWQVLLHRYSGMNDVAVGVPIANRSLKEAEGLIGFFANTVVMRTDFSGNPTFRQLLAQVRKTALEAYDHQRVPFERLVEDLAPRRDLSRNPLFQVAFQLFSAPRWDGPEPAVLPECRQVNLGTAKVDLRLDLTDLGTHIEGYLEYSTALWEAESIARMAEHYCVLVETIVVDPDRKVSSLPLLTDGERHQLFGWSHGGRHTSAGGLHELFEHQAARTPDAVAMVAETTQTSFEELNRQANQLARYLEGLDVGRGTIVGVCTGRSAETVAALLGVLKAGAAYLPLDPGYPSERLRQILDDAAPPVVIASRRWREQLAGYRGRVVWLEDEESAIGQECSDDVQRQIGGHDLAYVIYTSGSTGLPKGVLIEHGGAVNVAVEQVRRLGVVPGDRVLQFAALGFDASIFDMIMTLAGGATLVVTECEKLLPGPPLLRTLRDKKISILTIPPSSLAALPQEPIPTLRVLSLAGEAAPAVLASDWSTRCQLFNLYGPTEGTIWATVGELDAIGRLPIGRPIRGVDVYVLDPEGEPVPVGVPGELYIGGAGVARGYLNQPELTALMFNPDPLSGKPGARLYRTGDRVRYSNDGNLEFLGRVDNQVKVRGFRVEPAEIESALAQHPAVRESVVIARADAPGDVRLTAYVVRDVDYRGAGGGQTAAQWDREQVARWMTTYDATYEQIPHSPKPIFNTIGWNSSYTGEPIPSGEMQEQVDATVERILALRPQRVLEIGCGIALLLFRVAPFCTSYCATDFSAAALDYVKRQIGEQLPQVELRQATADDFSFVERGSFDLVLLNSVVQYFPSPAYLERVLDRAVQAVRPGGHVFVGDVRSLELCEAFHASVELTRASAELRREEVRQVVARQVRQEQELLVGPGFFAALRRRQDEISAVEIQLKRGRDSNELTRFRYDVMLEVGRLEMRASLPEELAWEQVGNVAALTDVLRERRPKTLVVRGIPNARVEEALEGLKWLRPEEDATIGDWREQQAHTPTRGVEPEAIWDLEKKTGYEAHVGWSDEGGGGRFDALLRQPTAGSSPVAGGWQRMDQADQPLSYYTNDPQQHDAVHRFVPALREYLRDRFPDHMVPSDFVLLETLPLTPNGKVDRTNLPSPAKRMVRDAGFVAPRTQGEQQIARVWQEVLGIKTCGVNDNFFDLGGHSLLMVRVHGHLCEALKADLSITDLFRFPTISALAEFLGPAAEAHTFGAVEDRAGKQRNVMNRRASDQRRYSAPRTKPEVPIVEAKIVRS